MISSVAFDSEFENEVVRSLNDLYFIFDRFDDHFDKIEMQLTSMISTMTDLVLEVEKK